MAAIKKQPKRKRLKRGRDWHVWVWKFSKCECEFRYENDVYDLSHELSFKKPRHKMSPKGRWVRVKFVEVPARKTGA